jgi:hypothetical protein
VSDGSGAAAGGADRSLGQRAMRTIQSKILVPLAATAVSVGVSYLARKLPLILEEKVLPKLKEHGAPELAKKVEAAANVAPGSENGSESSQDEPAEKQREQQEQTPAEEQPEQQEETSAVSSSVSNEEREAERRKREERRRERKRALSSA